MPALPRSDHYGALVFDAKGRHRVGLGLRQRRKLDRLPFAVEAVKLGRDPGRPVRVLAQQQIDAKRGAALRP